jgi:hypothetical protein
MHHRRRDGVVERHHRVVGDAHEQSVQRKDLGPVGVLVARCFIVNGGDCCLQLIRADRTARESAADEANPLQ